MTNEKLLETLTETFKELHTGDHEKGLSKLNALICDLKTTLTTENLSISEKQRFKTCLNYCEKLSRKPRIILSLTHFENDLQYFTDSVFAVELHDCDIMNDLPRHDKVYQFKKVAWSEQNAERVEYPNLKNIFANFEKVGDKHKIDLEKLYQFCKINKNESYITLDFGKERTPYLSADKLLLALTFGNMFKGKATIYLSNSDMKPIKFIKDNGTKMIICPIRQDGAEIKNVFTI